MDSPILIPVRRGQTAKCCCSTDVVTFISRTSCNNGRNSVGQQLSILLHIHAAFVCTPLAVACCYAKFETGQQPNATRYDAYMDTAVSGVTETIDPSADKRLSQKTTTTTTKYNNDLINLHNFYRLPYFVLYRLEWRMIIAVNFPI